MATTGLDDLCRALTSGDAAGASLVVASPGLVMVKLGRGDEVFVVACEAQLYAGDSALHLAAYFYAADTVRAILDAGGDVHAANRRGAQPLHAVAHGDPASARWDPQGQCSAARVMVAAGADPNARATGGVTPLHRAVRNRCAALVEVLLAAGADPQIENDHGSTVFDLVRQPTGRGGTGSAAAKHEQQAIAALLERHR